MHRIHFQTTKESLLKICYFPQNFYSIMIKYCQRFCLRESLEAKSRKQGKFETQNNLTMLKTSYILLGRIAELKRPTWDSSRKKININLYMVLIGSNGFFSRKQSIRFIVFRGSENLLCLFPSKGNLTVPQNPIKMLIY